ncbi:MAG TPA: shikimate kinase [Acidobacteriaceae bacterium]|nr:shikimate kinase [Acidobacteriaceae bacterium]
MALPRELRTILLTGFMGAGKSTVGALLAQKLGWEFWDADALVEARAGKSVAAIFADEGEAAFRALEAEVIRDHARRERLVLALGGGALETESTREFLSGLNGAGVIFLNAPLEVMVARCLAQPQAAERPVLADREGLRRRFEARLPHYRRAHLSVSTEGLTPGQVVDVILESLKSRAEGVSAQ